METPTEPRTITSGPGAPGPTRLRLALYAAALAGMLPYLVLKAFWVCGQPVGIIDTSLLDDPTMEVLNLATLAMEAVAVVAASALTFRWGMRLPAWLVVFPIWVAVGLLGHRVIAVPISVLFILAVGGADDAGTPLAQTWVYVVASLGFAIQGVALIAAFICHCRVRWGRLLSSPIAGRPVGATSGFQTVAVRGCAGLAVVVACFYVLAVVAAPGSDRALFVVSCGYEISWLVFALLGGLMLTRQLGFADRRMWIPLGIVLVGTGVLVWWGIWNVVNVLARSVLTEGTPAPFYDVAQFGGVCIGLVLAMVSAFTVAERADTSIVTGQPVA